MELLIDGDGGDVTDMKPAIFLGGTNSWMFSSLDALRMKNLSEGKHPRAT